MNIDYVFIWLYMVISAFTDSIVYTSITLNFSSFLKILTLVTKGKLRTIFLYQPFIVIIGEKYTFYGLFFGESFEDLSIIHRMYLSEFT